MKLWVNADDFGFSKSCSDAIFECFEKGYITTTTACANGEFIDYAIGLIKNTPYVDKIGLHINLTEGKPLTENIKCNNKICDKNGNFILFPKPYSRLSKKEKEDIYNEMQAQVDVLKAKGIKINHLDSHHHIHNSFRILPIVIELAINNNIKHIRLLRNAGDISFIKKIYKKILNKKIRKFAYSKYMGGLDDLYNSKIDRDDIFELMIHPDFDDNHNLIDRTNEDYFNPTGNLLMINIKDVMKG